MTVDHLHDFCDPHLVEFQMHLLAVLCAHISFRLPISLTHHILNFTPSVEGALLVLGSIFVSTCIPFARAFGGIRDRKRRADLERALKGLNWTRTSMRNRVIIPGDGVRKTP